MSTSKSDEWRPTDHGLPADFVPPPGVRYLVHGNTSSPFSMTGLEHRSRTADRARARAHPPTGPQSPPPAGRAAGGGAAGRRRLTSSAAGPPGKMAYPTERDRHREELPVLREEQIDLRRQRARAGRFQIDNLGSQARLHRLPRHQSRNRRLSTPSPSAASTSATTPARVPISKPTPSAPASTSKRSSRLWTTRCRRTSASERPPSPGRRSTCTTANNSRLGLHLPPRHSDALAALAKRFFDDKGLVEGRRRLPGADRRRLRAVPEEVTIFSDALDFIDRAEERKELLARERGIARAVRRCRAAHEVSESTPDR